MGDVKRERRRKKYRIENENTFVRFMTFIAWPYRAMENVICFAFREFMLRERKSVNENFRWKIYCLQLIRTLKAVPGTHRQNTQNVPGSFFCLLLIIVVEMECLTL